MSGQGPAQTHKMRRPNSPPQTRGPMKAVLPFVLKNSPSRSPSSPTYNHSWQRKSPVAEIRLSPDRRSPGSPGFKVERPKAVRGSPSSSSSSSLRRTSSLETITIPYLKGQWPADIAGYQQSQMSGSFMSDKGTQTSEDWQVERVEIKPEKKKKKHRRSASFGHADTKLALNCIRQKLQKTKDQGTKQRSSPIPANHNALLQTAPAVLMRSSAITINIPKASVPRHQRNSVEGLNPEIERLVQMTISGPEEEIERTTTDIPDGHRAPVPQIYSGMRSIDTQTPSSPCGGSNSSARVSSREGRSSSSPASPNRPHSFSPTIPIILGHLENSPRPSSCYDSPIGSTHGNKSDKEGDSDSISPADMYLKKTSSPKPNKILVREPPDGCEKVKFYDEDKSGWQPSIKEPLLFCPIEGQGKFELKPSLSSAFCPLKKLYNHTQGTANYTQTNSLTSVTSSIEGH